MRAAYAQVWVEQLALPAAPVAAAVAAATAAGHVLQASAFDQIQRAVEPVDRSNDVIMLLTWGNVAEDRGFEPLRVLPQHDFQVCACQAGQVHRDPFMLRARALGPRRPRVTPGE